MVILSLSEHSEVQRHKKSANSFDFVHLIRPKIMHSVFQCLQEFLDVVLQPTPRSHTTSEFSSTRLNNCREEDQLSMQVGTDTQEQLNCVLVPSLGRFDQLLSLHELAHVGAISMYPKSCLSADSVVRTKPIHAATDGETMFCYSSLEAFEKRAPNSSQADLIEAAMSLSLVRMKTRITHFCNSLISSAFLKTCFAKRVASCATASSLFCTGRDPPACCGRNDRVHGHTIEQERNVSVWHPVLLQIE